MSGSFAFGAACLLSALLPLHAQAPSPDRADPQVITSTTVPRSSSVTIYRTPYGADETLNLEWLQGYALITETRDVTIPAGRAIIRFEGVAGGMLPESAIVTGLPSGVREKNLDADLLSPRNLYARSFGRPVILRRLNRKTGAVTEERAIIRSGPDGAAILQTATGFEAANCGPLSDQLAYHDLPHGLSARPTLSVETHAPAAAHVRLTLSYLAWGFDWRANYVLQMRQDGRHADLTAWVAMASSDTTSFINATASVVGGKPHFEEERGDRPDDDGKLVFHCFLRPAAPVPPPPAIQMAPAAPVFIVVTAMRRSETAMDAPVTMKGETLGDLKLYRMPVPTTVSAHAQKQVALFDRRVVTFSTIYGDWISDEGDSAAVIILRTRNRNGEGLGVALPAGRVTVLEPHGGQMVRVGSGGISDKAVGEMVEIPIARSPQVHIKRAATGRGDNWNAYVVTVSNANPWPIHFEGKVRVDDDVRIASSSAALTRKSGYWLWAANVPANSRAVLHYRLQDVP